MQYLIITIVWRHAVTIPFHATGVRLAYTKCVLSRECTLVTLSDMGRTVKQAEAEGISMKVPTLGPTAAACWFSILEAQFILNKTYSQTAKFSHLTKQALTADIAQKVSDILLAPLDDLKKAILDRTQSTTAERISQLLAQQSVGNRNLSVECDNWPEVTRLRGFFEAVSHETLAS